MHKDSIGKISKSRAKQKIESSIKLPISTHLSSLINFSKTIHDRQKERERSKDEQLLMECITTGMSKVNKSNRSSPITITAVNRHTILAPVDNTTNRTTNISNTIEKQTTGSKNGVTTSVVVSDPLQQNVCYITPGVVEIQAALPVESIKEVRKNQMGHQSIIMANKIGSNATDKLDKIVNDFQDLKISQLSYDSLNLSTELNPLEISNEYPALKLSNFEQIDDSSSCNEETTFEMENSNEFLMEPPTDDFTSIQKIDKHKDPDLMLKSVERFTQELVSTAEYLRTNALCNSNNNYYDETEKRLSDAASSTNNTWNEDTCPNDISFPSISMTAPMIASLNDDDDATISDINSMMGKHDVNDASTPINDKPFKEIDATTPNYKVNEIQLNKIIDNTSLDHAIRYDSFINCTSQPNSLDTDTDTIVNDDIQQHDNSISNDSGGIHFQVGGKFHQHANYFPSNNFSMVPTTASHMTNSTVIAFEAQKLVTELFQNSKTMLDSATSLDLDNIRPPSSMDSLGIISGCYDIPNSPQLNRMQKKLLPPGLMAKRAINNHIMTGSLDSVNSSYNIDNIKPPSCMDELLDSMMSVDSITSEIVEHSNNNDETISLDDTFNHLMDNDDDSVTFKTCADFSIDDNTLNTSDFSSAESTPKRLKLKRLLTPKQKRQMVKDRYKTYTIETAKLIDAESIPVNQLCTDDTKNTEDKCSTKKLTPRQRRLEDKTRFQTQVCIMCY